VKSKIILLLAGLTIIAIVVFGLVYFSPKTKINSAMGIFKPFLSTPGYYKITKVVDGDTFEVNMDGHIERIRLIGLDTPETQKPNSPIECFGVAASVFAHKLLDGQEVRLTADPINTNRDRYGRLLRYAFLKNGTLVNAEIIKKGYGFAYLSFPFTKSDEFREYQKTARLNSIGLWGGECSIRDENGRLKSNSL
jgi:micrococcal nuclease